MSEIETYEDLKTRSKVKRQSNHKGSMQLLDDNHIKYDELAPNHYRIAEFDFWPTTGVYIHRSSGSRGRGVFNLLRALNKAGIR